MTEQAPEETKEVRKIIITMDDGGLVKVEGTILDEISTLGLMEKGKQILIDHYRKHSEKRILKPGMVPFAVPPGMKIPH